MKIKKFYRIFHLLINKKAIFFQQFNLKTLRLGASILLLLKFGNNPLFIVIFVLNIDDTLNIMFMNI